MAEPLPRALHPSTGLPVYTSAPPQVSGAGGSLSPYQAGPVHPVRRPAKGNSGPAPYVSLSSVPQGMPESGPDESSRGRSRSTSTSQVYDLLLKTTTGHRGSTRTASQPPHSAGLQASAPPSSKISMAGRPRMASMHSEPGAIDPIASSPGTMSTLADLHDEEPLSASFPTARSPSLSLWNHAGLPPPQQRSPLLDRHYSLLNQAPGSPAVAVAGNGGSTSNSGGGGGNGNQGIRAGTSLPTSNWSGPRGRQQGGGPSPPSLNRARELSPVGTAAPAGGIGYSNMSPFTRDGSRQLPPFSTSPGGATYTHRTREHSVSAIGTGRREGSVLNGMPWNGGVDETDEDDPHGTTRSGATSRRHSLAVLPTRPAQVSRGFAVSPGSMSQHRPEPMSAGALGAGGSRSMGFTDDELSADLNSLQLSLDPAAQPQASPYSSSPRQRGGSIQGFGTSPTLNTAAVARAYFSGSNQQAAPFSPFAANQAAAPARSMPPYATAASTYTPQQTIDLMGPPVYFGAQTHPQPELVDLGKGLPMHHIPAGALLYFCEFKAGRTDLFYVPDPNIAFQKGDLVIVEADRGKDLGQVVHDGITREEVLAFQKHSAELALGQMSSTGSLLDDPVLGLPLHAQSLARMVKEIHPKQIYGLASPGDISLLTTKDSDEAKALMIVRAKVESRQMPMALTDAEWQIDRRKLTIFYVANRRIDFRELVRELFKVFKTRIWFSPVERQTEGPTPIGRF